MSLNLERQTLLTFPVNRFESLTLSHNNMVALKPILQVCPYQLFQRPTVSFVIPTTHRPGWRQQKLKPERTEQEAEAIPWIWETSFPQAIKSERGLRSRHQKSAHWKPTSQSSHDLPEKRLQPLLRSWISRRTLFESGSVIRGRSRSA